MFRSENCPKLPEARLPPRPAAVRPSDDRIAELRRQFEQAAPRRIITLGAEPLSVVLGHDMPLKLENYGQPEQVEVWGRTIWMLRLCHPRQAGGLGAHSPEWKSAHENWSTRVREVGGLVGLERALARLSTAGGGRPGPG